MKLFSSVFLIIVTIVICWTPYCMISMYTAFISDLDADISPFLSAIASAFAKSSLLWPSLIYLYSPRILNSSRQSIAMWILNTRPIVMFVYSSSKNKWFYQFNQNLVVFTLVFTDYISKWWSFKRNRTDIRHILNDIVRENVVETIKNCFGTHSTQWRSLTTAAAVVEIC